MTQWGNLKYLKIYNSLFFIVYVILFLYFGKISTILFDGSHSIFKIYTLKEFLFYENRYPTIINYILPVLCSKLNLSFSIIFWATIINYALLPIGTFVYLRYITKNEQHVTIFLVAQCFFSFNIFFIPSHDALTGYYLIFILFSLLDKQPNISNSKYFHVIFILSCTIALSHLSQTLTIFLLLFYFFLKRKANLSLLYSFIATITTIIIKLLFITSSAEAQTLEGFDSILSEFKCIYTNITFIAFFKSLFKFKFNYITISVFLYVLYKLYQQKKYLLSTIIVSYFLFLIIFISIFFLHFRGYNFYTEMQYKSLAILIAILFIKETINLQNKKLNKIFFSIIYLFFIFQIYWIGQSYLFYYDSVKNLVSKGKNNVLLVYPGKLNHSDEQTFLPLESFVINMYENNDCHFIGMRDDANINKIGFFPENASRQTCFNDSIVILDANDEMKKAMESKYVWYIWH